MDDSLIIVLTSLVTGIVVAGVNHYWNRRYLMAVEREKYRQTIFRIKVKVSNEIASAIHTYILFAAHTLSAWEQKGTADIHDELAAIYLSAVEVYTVIHKNMLYIPEKTLDRITSAIKLVSPPDGDLGEIKLNTVVKLINDMMWEIMNLLRDNLGIEKFGETLD